MFSLFKTASQSAPQATNGSAATDLPSVQPYVDLQDEGQRIVLTADLPGVASAGLEVTVDGDRLTVRGRPAITAPTGMHLVHAEVQPRVFERTFILSETIDREGITARIVNGVAEITLPRRQAATPRRVAVQVA
jgi:HSP20 family molecular chaperone IbpA